MQRIDLGERLGGHNRDPLGAERVGDGIGAADASGGHAAARSARLFPVDPPYGAMAVDPLGPARAILAARSAHPSVPETSLVVEEARTARETET